MKRAAETTLALIASIRGGEVLLLQGTPLIGLLFAAGRPGPSIIATFILFAAASFLLVAHVFAINDWADFTRGVHHSNRAMAQLEQENITPRLLLCFSFALLAASLLIFWFLSQRCFQLAAAIAILGILYSHPSLNLKSMPVVASVLHFSGGLLHFLLGYLLFSQIDARGIVIGSFFALTFTAGHLNQEVRDYDVDTATGARTNAVAFGKTAAFLAGAILFTLCYVDLFYLAWTETVPRPLIFLPIILLPIHLLLSFRTFRRGLTSENIRWFQGRYRILYALIGIAMLVAHLRGPSAFALAQFANR